MLEKLFLSGNVISQFMHVLPISLLAAVVFVYVRRCSRKRRFSSVNKEREAVLAVFVCYLTGLLSLVWTPNNFWTYIWFYLFNGYPGTTIGPLFKLEYSLIPSIVRYWRGELTGGSWVQFMAVGNVLMFIPLGFLLPLLDRKVQAKNMVFVFFSCSLLIEIIQPVFGRSFDVDDLIYNTIGAALGFALFALFRMLCPKTVAGCRVPGE